MLQIVVGSAVDVLRRYNMIARVSHRLKRVGDGCGAGADRQRAGAVFKRRDPRLEDALGGIRQPAVDVACVLQSEAGLAVIAVPEYVGCRLVNRNGSCVRRRIRLLLSDMSLLRLKMPCRLVLICDLCHLCVLLCAISFIPVNFIGFLCLSSYTPAARSANTGFLSVDIGISYGVKLSPSFTARRLKRIRSVFAADPFFRLRFAIRLTMLVPGLIRFLIPHRRK